MSVSAVCSRSRLPTVQLGKQLGELNQQIHLSDMRAAYRANEDLLLESNLPSRNPFEFFHLWFQQASAASNSFEEANATCLSTATSDGKPSSRMVLLKGYSPLGFKFFSCYTSRKGHELMSNPNAAMLFYWPQLHRQVRIEGCIDKLPAAEADEYWPNRPLESRLSAYVSQQGQTVSSRKALELAKSEARDRLDGNVPRPENWGGYILKPMCFEFWQGQSDRLHDRIVFRLRTEPAETIENQWDIERLQP